MKRLLSLILALMMISSAAILAVSADVIYEDDFNDEEFDLYDVATGEGFWFKNLKTGEHGMGKFEETGGTLNGFDDAKFAFSMYWGNDEVTPEIDFEEVAPIMNREMTVWIDVKVDESGISEDFAAGLAFVDSYDKWRGYSQDRDTYYVLYNALQTSKGTTKTSFVSLSCATERREKDNPDHIYGEYFIEGDPYFNINGEAVKIGIRFGNGNITAYANGKIVGSYDRETIGMQATPAAWIYNQGCYVEFDNYGLGTYDHNVKKMTRPEDYALYEGKITVMDGETEVGVFNKAEDDVAEITAPKVEGKKFVKWEGLKIGDVEVTEENKDKIALLYCIDIDSFENETFKITMPDTDVVLKAVYEESQDEEPVLAGDANGDGKLNAKDVTAIMKHLVGATPKAFDSAAADYDANGKINAKDVTGLMKYLVNA
jgi:hypothetical protein